MVIFTYSLHIRIIVSRDYRITILTDLTDKASRALNPPLPKLIIQRPAVDVFAMEQTMITLQRQNTDYKNQLQQQDDVLFALRRDLIGANARLSDIAGMVSSQWSTRNFNAFTPSGKFEVIYNNCATLNAAIDVYPIKRFSFINRLV